MTIKDYVHNHALGLTEAIKFSPPIGVLSAKEMGANVQNWILIATLVYTLLLILHKVFQIWKDLYRFRKNQDSTMRGDLE